MINRTVEIGGRNIKLLSALGQGTYGTVYRIEIDNVPKAIKIITNKSDNGIKSLRELDIMSKLVHPNIMHSSGIVVGITSEITVGIIMELATTDLQRFMTESTFTLPQRLKILYDVLSGTHFIHQSGYLHLDLKPMNVLLIGEGNNMVGKITDFGISLLTDQSGTKYFPLELVTITHRAPEVLEGQRTYSIATDVWSLGIIFLEVLSVGKRIYDKFDKSHIKAVNNKYLSSLTIDNTLNAYLIEMDSEPKRAAIDIIKQMLRFDSKARPSLESIMKSSLFDTVPKSGTHNQGSVVYNLPFPPRKCDPIYYQGFDMLLKIAEKLLLIKTETVFLAADMYQRSLAYAHKLTGEYKKDIVNVILLSTTCIYMAIKMIEPYYPKPEELITLTNNIFTRDDLIRVESCLVQMFGGVLYSRNLFTETRTEQNLLQIFDYLRNCHMYHTIDLDQWKLIQTQVSLNDNSTKDIIFSSFYPKTKYYQDAQKGRHSQYIKEMYKTDLNKSRR